MGRAPVVILLLSLVVVGWFVAFTSRHMARIAQGIEAFEPKVFDRLTVLTLGTGGAYENHQRRGPCVAVGLGERLILVDVGRAVAEGLRASEIPLTQAGMVLLTSLVPENTVGLDDLLLTGWLGTRTRPLRVVGPPGTAELVEGLLIAHGAAVRAQIRDMGLPAAGARIDVVEAGDGWSEADGDLSISAALLPDGPLPALAWRFEASGRSAVIGGTGWGDERLIELARGAQLLVHEALLRSSLDAAIDAGAGEPERLRREAARHTALEQVGPLAARAGVATLVLTRLRPPPYFDHQFTRVVGETFPGRVYIAEDGDEFMP